MKRAPPRQIEHNIQAGLFEWREWRVKQVPQLQLLHAVPNGAGLHHKTRIGAAGKEIRFSPEAMKLIREGLTKGILDVSFPVARGRYHGLYIEHKAPGELTSEDQDRIMAVLQAEGYYVIVSCQCDFSIRVIEGYLSLGSFRVDGPTMESLSWPNWQARVRRKRKTKEIAP